MRWPVHFCQVRKKGVQYMNMTHLSINHKMWKTPCEGWINQVGSPAMVCRVGQWMGQTPQLHWPRASPLLWGAGAQPCSPCYAVGRIVQPSFLPPPTTYIHHQCYTLCKCNKLIMCFQTGDLFKHNTITCCVQPLQVSRVHGFQFGNLCTVYFV